MTVFKELDILKDKISEESIDNTSEVENVLRKWIFCS